MDILAVVLAVVIVVVVVAAVFGSTDYSETYSPAGPVKAALPHAMTVVDKMEWSIRGCKSLGWVLGGVVSQLKALKDQRQAMPRSALLRQINLTDAARVLPNVDAEIRTHIAGALKTMLDTLWPARLTASEGADLVNQVWEPACAAIRERYGK